MTAINAVARMPVLLDRHRSFVTAVSSVVGSDEPRGHMDRARTDRHRSRAFDTALTSIGAEDAVGCRDAPVRS
jgi:hypothetical protein